MPRNDSAESAGEPLTVGRCPTPQPGNTPPADSQRDVRVQSFQKPLNRSGASAV
jgi:hypothetical protein